MGDFFEQFDRVPVQQKVLLLLFVLGAIAAAFYVTIYTSLADEIVSKRNQVQKADERLAELRALEGDIERIRKDIDGLCERQASFLAKLPDAPEYETLVKAIDSQARLAGLTVEQQNPKPQVKAANYTTIPVEMAVRGSYDQIADFLYFLGRQQRIINVSDIDLGAAAARKGSATGMAPTLSAKFTIKTYFADAKTQSGGAACKK